jgi:hypothetical protein
MPWTFAHPATALAFNHVAKKPRDFAALVIGCISPDIGYYLGSAGLNLRTHSFVGSLKFCLPMALALFFSLMLLRRPLCLLLPKPHRQALWPFVNASNPPDVKYCFRICAWILVGAWTHIVWDAFTHRNGLVAQHLPPLQSIWLFAWPGYQLAQHLSSALGVLILCVAYARWLRTQVNTTALDDRFERWRWRLIFGSGATAILLGLPHAIALANAAPIALFWRVLMFQFAIRTTSIFAILIVCSALLLFWRVGTLKFAPAKKSNLTYCNCRNCLICKSAAADPAINIFAAGPKRKRNTRARLAKRSQ